MPIADFAVYVLEKVSGYADFETLNFLHIFIRKSRIAVLFRKFSIMTEKISKNISFTLDNTTSMRAIFLARCGQLIGQKRLKASLQAFALRMGI